MFGTLKDCLPPVWGFTAPAPASTKARPSRSAAFMFESARTVRLPVFTRTPQRRPEPHERADASLGPLPAARHGE
jgi:hypothetical protein